MRIESETIESLETLCEERPGSLAFARLAWLYLESGDADRAIRICVDGLRRYPNYVTARLVLGRCYESKGRWQEAALEFHRVCRIDHRNPVALKHLADCLQRLQQPSVAGSIYSHLHECDPDNSELKQIAGSISVQPPASIRDLLNTLVLGSAPTVAATTPTPASVTPPTPAPAPSTTVASSGPTVSEVKVLADVIENAETIALAPTPSSQHSVSGEDVSYRIDALFGSDEKSIQGPPEKAAAPLHDEDALTALFAAGQSTEAVTLDTGRFKMDEIPPAVLPASPLAETEEQETQGDVFGATMAFEAPSVTEEEPADATQAVTEPPLPPPPLPPEPPTILVHDVHAAGPSGTDVSSRLDELFELDVGTESPAPHDSTEGSRETAEQVVDTESLEGVRSEHIETASGETVTFLDEMTPESDKTAVLSPEEQTAMLYREPSLEEPSDETVMMEKGHETVASTTTSESPGAPSEGSQVPPAAPSVVDLIFEPQSLETAELALDQEMSFADSDKPQPIREKPTESEESVSFVSVQELTPDGEALMPPETPVPSASSAPPKEPATVPGSTADDDIFADTWLGAEGTEASTESPAQAQTLEERTEEAQTIAFARDELEDLVALSAQSEEIDKQGDTTTIKPLTELIEKTAEPAEGEPTEEFASPHVPFESAVAGTNPFEAYAQEISQAQTIAFRRDELAQLAGAFDDASKEEQAELNEQIRRAQTVQFERDQLQRITSDLTPPQSVAAPQTEAPSTGKESPTVAFDAVFVDEVPTEQDTVAAPAAPIASPTPETKTELITDPFVAETLLHEDPVVSAPPLGDETEVDTAIPIQSTEDRTAEQAATRPLGRSEDLPSAELVWEEGPRTEITLVSTEQRDRGNLADTVAMSDRTFTELERTERMEPLSEEPSEQEREEQLASIPDHVLTPTLADIYYHQGQPRLAVQIYRRLLQLHPENTRIAARLAEIEAALSAQGNLPPAQTPPPSSSSQATRGSRTGRRKKSKTLPPRPLAGVRISKTYRERYQRKKRTRRSG